MKSNQKLTPKYWIGHDVRDSDVFLTSASKTKVTAANEMSEMFGEDWIFDEFYRVDLFEINLCGEK